MAAFFLDGAHLPCPLCGDPECRTSAREVCADLGESGGSPPGGGRQHQPRSEGVMGLGFAGAGDHAECFRVGVRARVPGAVVMLARGVFCD